MVKYVVKIGRLGFSKKSFKTKTAAQKHAKFIKHMDDDLPVRARNKSLKSAKVIKIMR